MNVASSDSQIDKPQRGRPKRAELPDVNRNTGAQSINTEGPSLTFNLKKTPLLFKGVKDDKLNLPIVTIAILIERVANDGNNIHHRRVCLQGPLRGYRAARAPFHDHLGSAESTTRDHVITSSGFKS